MQRRWALTEGEGLPGALAVFFASKRRRRDLEIAKFGAHRPPAPSALGLTPATAKHPTLDTAWYAETHALPSKAEAARHYAKQGLVQALAPCEAMAGADGRTLAQWAAEYLVRTSAPLGAPGEKALSPEDPQALRPFAIHNPARKRLAVVSAIFGGFDRLLPVDPAWAGTADFHLVTDRRFEALHGWQPVQANYTNADPRRSARFV
ncbi:MAG: hypothetical protein AAGI34_19685, partial [Pseudomonadota bacterium]